MYEMNELSGMSVKRNDGGVGRTREEGGAWLKVRYCTPAVFSSRLLRAGEQ